MSKHKDEPIHNYGPAHQRVPVGPLIKQGWAYILGRGLYKRGAYTLGGLNTRGAYTLNNK